MAISDTQAQASRLQVSQLHVSQLQAQLTLLKQQQSILLAEIQTERDEGLPNPADLKASINTLEAQLQLTNKKLEKNKALVKRRKEEIKQWKENFARIEKTDKSQDLIQLQTEIDWRAKEIAEKESEIASTYDIKNTQTGAIENLNIKLIIVEQGYHKQEINQDPRLLALSEEIDELEKTITLATPKQKPIKA